MKNLIGMILCLLCFGMGSCFAQSNDVGVSTLNEDSGYTFTFPDKGAKEEGQALWTSGDGRLNWGEVVVEDSADIPLDEKLMAKVINEPSEAIY